MFWINFCSYAYFLNEKSPPDICILSPMTFDTYSASPGRPMPRSMIYDAPGLRVLHQACFCYSHAIADIVQGVALMFAFCWSDTRKESSLLAIASFLPDRYDPHDVAKWVIMNHGAGLDTLKRLTLRYSIRCLHNRRRWNLGRSQRRRPGSSSMRYCVFCVCISTTRSHI